MGFGAHHRPEVTDRLDIVILRKRGLGDVLQRLAGRIGQQMEMQPHYGHRSVDNMPATASATSPVRQATGSLRITFRSSPISSTAPRQLPRLWITGTDESNRAMVAASDGTSVGEGKEVYGRSDSGGPRRHKKKKKTQ